MRTSRHHSAQAIPPPEPADPGSARFPHSPAARRAAVQPADAAALTPEPAPRSADEHVPAAAAVDPPDPGRNRIVGKGELAPSSLDPRSPGSPSSAGRPTPAGGRSATTEPSASAAGIDRTSAYRRANRQPAFAAAWEDAWQDSIDDLEGEARRRALEKSDALLMFQLRAYRPERYRESFNVRVDVRREAERIAARFGVPVEEVLDRLERQAEEALKK